MPENSADRRKTFNSIVATYSVKRIDATPQWNSQN